MIPDYLNRKFDSVEPFIEQDAIPISLEELCEYCGETCKEREEKAEVAEKST